MATNLQIGKRIALISIAVSGALALAKIATGWYAGSTSVVADGLESAGDVCASTFVLVGFILAARPADEDHPYGHGRYETLTGLIVRVILFPAVSVSVTNHSVTSQRFTRLRPPTHLCLL